MLGRTDASAVEPPPPGLRAGGGLLRTKLAPPLIRGDTVARERLQAALDKGRYAKLALIHAPAGYGKTTLMVQWMKHLQTVGERVAWLGLDSSDNDVSQLLAELHAAMLPHEPDRPLDLFALINRCAAEEQPFTLFLDEVEALTEAAALQLVCQLLEYSPPQLHIVMGTRSVPDLPLARLRVRGDLIEIDGQDLRFALREAAEFLYVRCGVQLSKATMNELLERTEGWAAALQLLALSLRQGTDQDMLHHLSGSRTQIIEYLAVDVVAKLPEDMREFLMQTSILRRLSGPLCNAVTGAGDGTEMLQRLENANLFVLAIDQEREWYRYHALFAEFLRDRLLRTAPECAAANARRASDWCADHGFLAEAVDYSLQARDYETAIERLLACVDQQIQSGQFRRMRGWIAALPDTAVEREPRLLVARAWAATFCQEFELAERLIGQLRRIADNPTTSATLRKSLVALEPQLLISTGRIDLAAKRAAAGLLDIGRDSPFERGRIATALAYTRIASGRHEEAQRLLREAEACHSMPPPSVLGLVYAMGYSALLEFSLGNLSGALHLLRSIDHLVTDQGRTGPETADVSFLPAFFIGNGAEMLYELNELDDAEEWLDRRFGLIDSIPTVQSVLLAYVVRGRLLLARGERQAAEEVLLAGSRHALRNGIERLTHAVEWERVRIALTEGDVPRARVLARSLAPHPPADVPPTLIETYDEVNGAGIETMRLHLHDGDPQTALGWVDMHIEHAAGALRRRRLMKLHILRALALRALGRNEEAVDSMAAAVTLAAPMGAVRSFSEEGSGCQALLSALAARPGPWADEKTKGHVRTLLSTFDGGTPEPEAAQVVPAAVGDDTLSKREAQILQRLSQGYSNLAVAQQLFVSTHTVKWHLRQIYDKLGARNRSQAIFRARQLGLLQ